MREIRKPELSGVNPTAKVALQMPDITIAPALAEHLVGPCFQIFVGELFGLLSVAYCKSHNTCGTNLFLDLSMDLLPSLFDFRRTLNPTQLFGEFEENTQVIY